MVSINYALREISCKIVYYGPGLSGKTTNLQFVHGKAPEKSRGELISLATEADRTLYFDFLPLDVGQIAGFATKFQLYTVPGQVFYNATRRLVLRGVDGLVFVADSQVSKMDENIESLNNMYDNLQESGIVPDSLPLVFQWNKRDIPGILPVETLEAALNPRGMPSFEAVAPTGVGVFDTLKKITKMVLEDARSRAVERSPESSRPASASIPNQTAMPQPAATPPLAQEPEPVGVGITAAAAGEFNPSAPTKASPLPAATPARPVPHADRPAPAEEPEEPSVLIHRSPSLKVRERRSAAQREQVFRAQKSLKIRPKKKSFFARLFGRLFGR
jgi:signal recognition particle receptor subunit beta